ncbi:MAG: RNA polymerase factor sigma-32 [Magnetococcales bacterium]|nr:RNA polymerase factor sigma-32 [Magnetococcales bacterium]
MSNLPIASHRYTDSALVENDSGFQKFLRQALEAPILSSEEEFHLATRYQENDDLEAAHRLVHAYLRLVLKTAREYLNYRMSLADLVQEGTVGLMQAVKKFDPKRGNRLATYAIWWIRAAIHDYILRSFRMVKIATTQLKRQLFFKLRQAKEHFAPLERDEAEELARKFGTDADTILEVDSRMNGADTSLNQPVLEGDGEMIDGLPDQRPGPEHELLSTQHQEVMTRLIGQGLEKLNPREQAIITARFLTDKPLTLETLSHQFGISRERVRQIEKKGMSKLQTLFHNDPLARELISEI